MGKYKIELHAHSLESSRCGSIQAAEVVKKYYKAGYDALVLTDHYYARFFDKIANLSWSEQLNKYLAGYKAAKKAAQNLDFQVFLGLEIKFNDDPNEYLIYGVTEQFLFENPNLHYLNLESFKELVEKVGKDFLIYQAHPYREGMYPAADKFLNGLEVYNGNPRHDSKNDEVYLYAKEHNLEMISGSDFHEKEDLARGGIITKNKVNKMIDLLFLLKNGDYKLIRS